MAYRCARINILIQTSSVSSLYAHRSHVRVLGTTIGGIPLTLCVYPHAGA